MSDYRCGGNRRVLMVAITSATRMSDCRKYASGDCPRGVWLQFRQQSPWQGVKGAEDSSA
jgi:hypothetical protein